MWWPPPVILLLTMPGAECAGEEDERPVDWRDAQVVDAPYDDPVVPGRVLGDGLTLEAGEGVLEQWYATGAEFPVEARESVRAGGGSAYRVPLVLPTRAR